jgi:CheY-like chemotaxis protein
MLCELVIAERPPPDSPPKGASGPSPRLLIVHNGDCRLAALEAVLSDLGYDAAMAANGEDAVAAIAHGPLPDVLLTIGQSNCPRRGLAFARDCLARWPTLRAIYVSFLPRPLPDARSAREHVLIAPFNANQLAMALCELWPGKAAIR